MPQFVAGDTQFDTNVTEPSAFVTPGIASLNLRGLGVNRNLVLVDGRRAQPANALLIVDINTIPTAAIERVETITGGASAVYGADALAGVVNFVLKDDFEGVALDVQTGETFEGDGSESSFSALIGMNAAEDRGNVMFGVDWTKRSVVYRKDRDWRKAAGWFDPGSISGGFLQTPGYRAGAAADARFPTVQLNPPSQAAMDAVWAQYLPNFDPTATPCTGAVAASTCSRVSNTAEIFWNPDGTPFLQNGLNYRGPFMHTDARRPGLHGRQAPTRWVPRASWAAWSSCCRFRSTARRPSAARSTTSTTICRRLLKRTTARSTRVRSRATYRPSRCGKP